MQELTLLHSLILALIYDILTHIFLLEFVHKKRFVFLLLHLTPLKIHLLELLAPLIKFLSQLLVLDESDLAGANPRNLH